MASIEQLLEDIAAAPAGPGVAAIFDFDGTVIAGYSATVFILEQLRRGDLSPGDLLQVVRAMGRFGLGNLDFSALLSVNAQFMSGIDEDAYEALGQQLYRNRIARLIYPESRRLIRAHQQRGHTVAIISSATPYQVAAAARDLGIEHLLCSHLEVEDGKFTGEILHPTCFGQGKVDAAEALAAETGADLEQSFFYSDSDDDLLLLQRVGRPRALNPGPRLKAIARREQWPAARFSSRGRPGAGQWVRSVAATGSLVTSFLAGLPIYALTGSRRESTNFSMSLFADTAAALIGMQLRVRGEQHLWSHRPAVFIFNHQSKADVIIIAKLLRRDLAGIGKKEIQRENPLTARAMQLGGTVFIDRENTSSAIEAIAPLIEVMREHGKSVVLAPEGTRTVSPTLAPFKKGAFHIAMQAGAPIVPIVIHNAGDVAPKGDFVFRPATVEVDVLEPIDTRDWREEDIDRHVREVRNRFARTLGQTEEPAPGHKPAAKTKTAGAVKARTKGKSKSQRRRSADGKAATGQKATAKKGTTGRTGAAKKTPVKQQQASPKKQAPPRKRKAAAKQRSSKPKKS